VGTPGLSFAIDVQSFLTLDPPSTSLLQGGPKPDPPMKTPLYLLKDIVIPAGTKFETAPLEVSRCHEGHVSHIVGLSKDTSGDLTYYVGPEGSKERQQLEEMFSTEPLPQPAPMETFDFSLALEAVRKGCRITRLGWAIDGQFVYLVPANAYPAQTRVAKAHFGEGSLVPYDAYFALKNAEESVSIWTPSTTDILANDWVVL
jgi:hypothetical protein